MRLLDPPRRLALSLALLTVGVLLLADALRVVPDERGIAVLGARQMLTEALGVQLAPAIGGGQMPLVEHTLRQLVQRNPDVLSAALRTTAGELSVLVGDHMRYWRSVVADRSTSTHAQIPIFTGSARWGTLEIAFAPVYARTMLGVQVTPIASLSLFMAVAGFLVYAFFLRRALRILDPNSVVPPRVKMALDALAEGVAFIDRDERVAMVNTTFVRCTGLPQQRVVGRALGELDWCQHDSEEPAMDLPWTHTLADGQPRLGVALRLGTLDGERRSFSVNCSAISDDQGRPQGALVTLDDVTEIEGKNHRLEDALAMLKAAQDEIRRHNDELEILAQRDGLTGCLNRRTLFEKLERRMEDSRGAGEPLCVIMADIDHFKSINDSYGHLTGDKVIQFVSNILKQGLRGVDMVGRYGGEEFCVVMPGASTESGMAMAERLRERIESEAAATLRFTDGRTITSSFGVAAMDAGTGSPAELLDRADQALYVSKESGRNRVSLWTASEEHVRDSA